MTSKTRTTIAISALLAVAIGLSIPTAMATAGTVESYWWKANTGMCYNASSLNNMNVGGSTGHSSTVITEVEQSRGVLNAEMNGVDITGDAWQNCYANHFDVASENVADSTVLAYELSYLDLFDSTKMTQSEIRFNTDHSWSANSSSCSTSSLDIQWIGNHEMGHGIGLKHHTHPASPDSMMYESCHPKYAALQTVDKTAIDIHYP